MNDFKQWYLSQPIMTRSFFTILSATTVLASFGFLSPYSLALFPEKLLEFQIWRLITNFFFMGVFSQHLIWTIFFLHFAFTRVESLFQPQQLADLLWLILFNMLVLDIVGLLFEFPLLLSSLMISFIYIWSKKRPFEEVYFLFGIRVKSAYFCFVLIMFHMITGKSILQDLVGVGVGHLYIILKDILPSKNHSDYLKTPEFFKILVQKYILGNVRIIGGIHNNIQQQPQQQQQNQMRQFQGRGVRIGGEERRNL